MMPAVRDGRFYWRETPKVAYVEPATRPGPRLRCAFTLRQAGRSGRALNLSFDRGERHEVLANRRRVLQALGLGQATLHTVRQVHGNQVCVIDTPTLASGLTGVCADALVTALPGVPIGVLVADCLPILLYSPQPRVVPVVHAGRMGTYHRVVEATLEVLRTRFAVLAAHVHAIMGPSIGACCYRLDARAVTPFQERFHDWERFFTPQAEGYWTMSLTHANDAQLQAAGVPAAHIQTADICTVCHNAYLYSHRAEGREAGRGMGIAALLA